MVRMFNDENRSHCISVKFNINKEGKQEALPGGFQSKKKPR
jgi:hypothetical protein